MTRRCSHCSNNGHNSRTCPSRGGGGVKIFGVRLTDGSIIKKSASMGNLTLSSAHNLSSSLLAPSSSSSVANPSSPSCEPPHEPEGYLSDDLAHASTFGNRRGGERKKGVPWTEEEHRRFLMGLQKLGKGDWRGIARNFVVTRTPTQVASHAQKYFIRQSHATRRKRRSSLFDMAPDTSSDPPSMPEEQELLPPSENSQPCNGKSQPSLNLSLKSEFDPMETTSQDNVEEPNDTAMGSKGLTQMATTGFFPTYLPVQFSIWPSIGAPYEEVNGGEASPHHRHEVLKPIPVIPREPVNVDELVGMSHLSIVEAQVFDREPSPLSLKLLGEPSRQSAFHANAPVSGSDLKSGKNSAIQAV